MKTRAIGAILLAALMGAAATGLAAEKAVRKVDLGKLEYEANCASCHDVAGKGDGVLKPYLTKSATDLTVIAKQNGGVFPINRVYEVIDGRTDVKASLRGSIASMAGLLPEGRENEIRIHSRDCRDHPGILCRTPDAANAHTDSLC